MNNRIRVIIADQHAFAVDAVSVFVIMGEEGDTRSVMHFNGPVSNWDVIEQNVMQEPTFTLPNDVARALLDTLTRHYQGASDMHTVRADLLHERGRVDKLIDVLMGNSRQLGDVADKLADC